MKTIFPLFFLGWMILTSVGCKESQSKPNGPHIYADFYIRWLQDTQELLGEASFSEGEKVNSSKPITMKQVTFLGSAMENRKLSQERVRYQYKNKAKFLPEYTLRYTTAKDELREFSIAMPAIDFTLQDTLISRSNGLTIELKEAPLRQDEQLVLLCSNTDGTENISYTIDGPTADKTIFIKGDEIANFPTGKGYLSVIKRYIYVHVEPNFNEKAILEVYATPIEVEVK